MFSFRFYLLTPKLDLRMIKINEVLSSSCVINSCVIMLYYVFP